MSLYNFFVFYLFINILNIPLACIFKKAGINYINAFIPFKNLVDYLGIVGVKRKYFYSLMILLVFLILTFLFDLEIVDSDFLRELMMYEFTFGKLLSWILLLLLIPICMIFWGVIGFLLGIFIVIDGFVTFIRSGNGLLEVFLSPGMIAISLFLIIFSYKSAYKLVLRFGWKHKAAILYVIFQPIAIWILAFGKWKYIGDCIETTGGEKNITDKTGNEVNVISNDESRTFDNESGYTDSLSEVSEQRENQSFQEVKSLVLKSFKLALWFILGFVLSLIFLFFVIRVVIPLFINHY